MSRSATFTPSSGLAAAMQLIEFGAPLEIFVVPSIGSMAMSKFRRTGIPRAELFAFENSRRFVLDSLADNHFAADVHEIEHAADGVAGCRIGCFLVAAPEPAQRVQCGSFGCADEIQLDDALDVLIILFRQSQSHRSLIFTQLAPDDKKSSTAGIRLACRSLGGGGSRHCVQACFWRDFLLGSYCERLPRMR